MINKTEEKILQEFGKRLKELRKERKLSTRKFAEQAEMAHSSVGRFETGKGNPTLTTLIKIAKALDINPCILIHR